MPGENAPLVPANKKATYAMHRVHTIRRRLIAGLPPGRIVLTHGTGNGKSLFRKLQILKRSYNRDRMNRITKKKAAADIG